jgi:flagellin-like protein
MLGFKARKRKAVSPVIAVILMVAITVVLAGVLYVWVSTLADTSSKTTIVLGVTGKDSPLPASNMATDPINGPTGFEKNEPIITIEHITGRQINWTLITKIQIKKSGFDQWYPLDIIRINQQPYTPSNAITQAPDSLELGIKNSADDNYFKAGDTVFIKMNGDGYMWQSPDVGIMIF